MAWYYHLSENTAGPVEATMLHDLLRQGVLAPDILVWSERIAQGTPFRNTPLADSGPLVAVGSQQCAECGRRLPERDMLHCENIGVCAKILSGLILMIGYLMAFWDEEKRALHDRVCDTRVVVCNS